MNTYNYFIAETPYQVFNCVNLADNDPKVARQHNILFIRNFFRGANSLIQRLGALKIFDEVFEYSYDTNASCVLSPKKFLTKTIGNTDCCSKRCNYIYTPVVTKMTIALMRINKDARLCFYEDGTGSYYGKINLFNLSHSLKATLYAYRCLNRIIKPEALYLNNVDMCRSEIKTEIRAFPQITTACKLVQDQCPYLFGEPIDEYDFYKFIVLSQPCDKSTKLNSIEYSNLSQSILDSLKGIEYIYRPHPRDVKTINTAGVIDDKGVLWEYICAGKINNANILIGYFSTSQFIPKLLFNKEPFIIFTFKLFGQNTVNEKFQNEVDRLKTFYSEPQRIFVPNNLQELKDIIKLLHISCFKDEELL